MEAGASNQRVDKDQPNASSLTHDNTQRLTGNETESLAKGKHMEIPDVEGASMATSARITKFPLVLTMFGAN